MILTGLPVASTPVGKIFDAATIMPVSKLPVMRVRRVRFVPFKVFSGFVICDGHNDYQLLLRVPQNDLI